MSKLGVFMLEKLVFQYSQSAGSSVGMRSVSESLSLPACDHQALFIQGILIRTSP